MQRGMPQHGLPWQGSGGMRASGRRASAAIRPQPTPRVTVPRAVRRVTAIDDAAVTLRVRAALLAEPGLDSLWLHIETKNGVVTLAGVAGTAAKRERVLHVALNVEGVAAVDDQLTVHGS